MINALLDFIVQNAAGIGTTLITALVAVLKRFLDKKKIRTELVNKGMNLEDVNKIV